MNRKGFVVSSVSAATVGSVLAADACSSQIASVAPNPTPIVPGVDSYTLKVGYATTRFGPYQFRTRTYDGRTTGPTLVTKPGNLLRVKIVNTLPPNPPVKVPKGKVRIPDPSTMAEMFARKPARTRLSTAPINVMDNPHDFNTTNLHVHGIQTIPHIFNPLGTSNPAARMISIEPGTSFEYPLPIPSDHPSGLFWYHPHHHGATDVQISGGMAGLLVVRGPIDEVPEIAAAREIFLAIQTLQVNPTPHRPNHFELEPVAYQPPPIGYALGTDYVMTTVNGQGVNWADLRTGSGTFTPLPPPEFRMRPGEVVRLRILNGTNIMILPLVLPGMDVFEIGIDGINLLASTRLEQRGTTLVTPSNMYDGSTMLVPSAGRSEILVRAPQTPGSYTLSAVATQGVSYQDWPSFELAKFVVGGSPVSMGIPTSLPRPTREYPLISQSEIAASRTLKFSEGNNDTILTGVGFYINDSLYDEMICSTFPKLGTAEEWTIVNTSTESHPFHIHENSFQVIEINGKRVDPVVIRDTVLIPPAVNGVEGTVKFRIRFKGYKGKSVYHCHITPHEDTGMMQNMLTT